MHKHNKHTQQVELINEIITAESAPSAATERSAQAAWRVMTFEACKR